MGQAIMYHTHKIYVHAIIWFVASTIISAGCQRKMPDTPQFIQETSPQDYPNAILIVASGLGYGDLGCYGQDKIVTKHIDQMAADGCRFTEFYAGGYTAEASYWCLMTGRYTHYARKDDTLSFTLRSEQRTVPETLQLTGFETCFIGNWPLEGDTRYSSPNTHGFGQWVGTMGPETADQYYPVSIRKNGDEVTLPDSEQDEERRNLQQLCLDEAIAFLKGCDADKPFFMVVALPSPGASAQTRIDPQYVDKDWPESAKAYASRVSQLDADVGAILAELDESGLAEDTAVMLTSDNARTGAAPEDVTFFNSAAGLKIVDDELYEGRLRVPFIVRWPSRVEAGTETDYPGAIWDMSATLVDMTGLKLPASASSGESLLPAMFGEDVGKRGMMYWEVRDRGFGQAVRIGDWKAVRCRGKLEHSDVELYNLKEDPGETADVSEDNPEILATFIP
jgi:arylsulfatase A-like enzyme